MDISDLKGIGAVRTAALAKAGIKTVADLLEYFPRDYDDRSEIRAFAHLTAGAVQTVRGIINGRVETVPVSRRGQGGKPLTLTKTLLRDGTGILELVWFNQPYLEKNIVPGREYVFTGPVRMAPNGRLQMPAPDYDRALVYATNRFFAKNLPRAGASGVGGYIFIMG
jgi:ATP-dependent DNA helicase RecG